MDDYNDILATISLLLADIANARDQPMSNIGNKYRQAAEAICKAIITATGQAPSGNMEKMVADSAKIVGLRERSRDASAFKDELRYLQNTGNTFSHPGASAVATFEDQGRARDALSKVIRLAFFGNGDLDPPDLPREFQRGLSSRALASGRTENLRPEQVVRLWMPNWRVRTKHQRSDSKTKVAYDYVEAESDDMRLGVLFLRTWSSLDASISECLASIGVQLPQTLHLVTPRSYRADGQEIDRKQSITTVLRKSVRRDNPKTIVEYYDEFVWKRCLPEQLRSSSESRQVSADIIPQSVQQVVSVGVSAPFPGNEYFDRVLTQSNIYDPVQVIIGQAGIGKTTLCDALRQHISSMDRKRVVLVSATDFRDVANPPAIRSVGDLYSLALKEGLMDEGDALDSRLFEINLACGNFVLIIDGFDELESHLGDALDFEGFMQSLIDLEESLRKVLVILTVRDYEKERFLSRPLTSIVQLRGFGTEDTERYLRRALNDQQMQEARSLLKGFGGHAGKDGETVPLYASLVREFLIELADEGGAPTLAPSHSAISFAIDDPLDRLVRKIVDREIAKQSLGSLTVDDFFDLLIEVIRAPKAGLPKEVLIEHIDVCCDDIEPDTADNFMRNPFLTFGEDVVRFKYDSLSYFFKSRLLARHFKAETYLGSTSLDFLAEMSKGDGPLFEELSRIMRPSEAAQTDYVRAWFADMLRRTKESGDPHTRRRAISGFLYWVLDAAHDQRDRSELINTFFGGTTWVGFSVIGKFYTVDLNDITVVDGYVENYTALVRCDQKNGVAVFFDSLIDFDERSLPDKLDRRIFHESCRFSHNLENAFKARENADDLSHQTVRDNLSRILKVGFRGNRFGWKSDLMYRTVTVVGRKSRETYLRALVDQGVLRQEMSNTGAETGYTVSDTWQPEARKLIEEGTLSSKLASVVQALQA